MTTARALAKTIVDEYSDSSMSLVLEVVRLVALEREHRASRQKIKSVPELETPTKIIAAVCSHYEVTERELKGSCRSAYLTAPRLTVWMLLRDRLGRSKSDIARLFGRDRSTITKMMALAKIDDRFTGSMLAIAERLDETKQAAHVAVGESAE